MCQNPQRFDVPVLSRNFSALDLARWVINIKKVESVKIKYVSALEDSNIFNRIVANIIANKIDKDTRKTLSRAYTDDFNDSGISNGDANALKRLMEKDLEYLPFAWAAEMEDRIRDTAPNVQALERVIKEFNKNI